MPDSQTERINKLVSEKLHANRLTFKNDGYAAHFLARKSIMDRHISQVVDTKKNKNKLSAGIGKSGAIIMKGQVFSSTSMNKGKRFIIQSMKKALSNLRNDYDDETIAKMLKQGSNVFYNQNGNDNYSSNPRLNDYKKYIKGIDSINSSIERERMPSAIVETVPNDTATTQTLFSLGYTKSDFFFDVFKHMTDIAGETTIQTKKQKKMMSEFLQTTLHYTNAYGMHNNFFKEGNQKYLETATKLRC